MIELDHLFIAVEPGAPEIESLLGLGLREGTPNAHPGQGTANRRIFFRNAMLELIWLVDAAEARSDAVRQTHLFERCARAKPNVCPFGICVRRAGQNPAALHFATWEYRPPYAPQVSIPMAHNAAALAEPLIFATPWGGRPDQAPPQRRQPLDHPAGVDELSRLVLHTPSAAPPSDALGALVASGLLTVEPAARYALRLVFDEGRRGRTLSLAPALPLVLSW